MCGLWQVPWMRTSQGRRRERRSMHSGPGKLRSEGHRGRGKVITAIRTWALVVKALIASAWLLSCNLSTSAQDIGRPIVETLEDCYRRSPALYTEERPESSG